MERFVIKYTHKTDGSGGVKANTSFGWTLPQLLVIVINLCGYLVLKFFGSLSARYRII